MRIGVLTGGGDVPGLNPCLKAAVNRVSDAGSDVVGIRRGWGGLANADPDDPESLAANTTALTPADVRTVDRSGGTFLHTSRTNPGRMTSGDLPEFLADRFQGEGPHDITPHVISVLERLKIDALMAIGGQRHAVLRVADARRGCSGHRHPEDDGQ